ncbi:hypothetical protein BUALT_Bualt16G0122600 [Buddleja alternifolia]|uniref:Small nuclear ribonucleoprotein E n=1 Tax=Buddleja alternifolia TaxID=168488 RepID=A0AAV6WHL9_9LAMI|nr:hypothetical protein BUALT_Bualt16G0122600 [Buddleja alternifolia]
MASTKVQRIMTQPINLIFRFLQSKARIQIWLFEQKDLRIEGRIIGFDEYMNLVLDDAEEVNVKKNSRKQLGRILLKGDNITLMMNTAKPKSYTGGLVVVLLGTIQRIERRDSKCQHYRRLHDANLRH